MNGSTSLSENAVTRSARSPRVVASSSEMPTRVGDAMRRLMRRARAAALKRGSAPGSAPMLRGSEKQEGATREPGRGGAPAGNPAGGGAGRADGGQAPGPV